MSKNTSIDAIVEQLGGEAVLAKRTNVTRQSVHNWTRQGIPRKFWPMVVKLGYSLEDVVAIDALAKKKFRKEINKKK